MSVSEIITDGHLLVQVGAARWFWYQRYHHLLIDGYGLAALTRRIAALYDAAMAGRVPTPASFVAAAGLAAEYDTYRVSEAGARDAAFWRETIGPDAPAPSLAVRETDVIRQLANVDVHRARRRMGAGPVAGLLAIGRAERLGVSEAALAEIDAYLHRMTGAADVSLGVPLMRRLESVAIDMVLPTIDVLPLRLRIAPDDALDDVVKRVAAAHSASCRDEFV